MAQTHLYFQLFSARTSASSCTFQPVVSLLLSFLLRAKPSWRPQSAIKKKKKKAARVFWRIWAYVQLLLLTCLLLGISVSQFSHLQNDNNCNSNQLRRLNDWINVNVFCKAKADWQMDSEVFFLISLVNPDA